MKMRKGTRVVDLNAPDRVDVPFRPAEDETPYDCINAPTYLPPFTHPLCYSQVRTIISQPILFCHDRDQSMMWAEVTMPHANFALHIRPRRNDCSTQNKRERGRPAPIQCLCIPLTALRRTQRYSEHGARHLTRNANGINARNYAKMTILSHHSVHAHTSFGPRGLGGFLVAPSNPTL